MMERIYRLLIALGVAPICLKLGGGGGGDNGAAQRQQQEEARKAEMRGRVNALFDRDFSAEENELSTALRGQYGDELGDKYKENERGLRFSAANTGNVGGSAQADKLTDLEKSNQMGGTRIEEAVRRAVNNLRASREDSRLRSLNLVNSGSGEEAVSAASSGIRQAIDSARASGRENLFGDLFQDLAFGKSMGDDASRNAEAAALFQSKRSPIVAGSTQPGGGRIINDRG